MDDEVKPAKRASQRRENRMFAIQFLYQWELNKPEQLNDALRVFVETKEEAREYYAFAEELIHGVIEHIDAVDEQIKVHAANWTFDRIAKVDLSVLRLAIYELLQRRDIPPIVSINEAIELGKIFSNPDSKRFINGILDQMKNKIDRPLRSAAE
ncbi:transcription antitermination factor NusB [Coraliomargarita sp. SDUM461004]|uniref:Transcription antitermination protein NusB n=1 Tax=Thalassobacterium sedimentorum TaxID=3041258 RepID=A0ABU1ALB0_9BACT|nr:transcription antitermination factor NusB [Coraliomargarita sp. SDUM461004]MDQ8194635.1 transcription antitermination factor NusB [Coraliomargarita sp. SDUM461004]